MHSRKWLISFMGVMTAFSLVLSACQGQKPSETSIPGSTQPPETAAPTTAAVSSQPKVFAIGMSQEPDTLWPYLSNMYVSTVVMDLVYENLVGFDDQMKPFPNLVTEIPSLDNSLAKFAGDGGDRHLEVTLKLKQGVKDSAGNELTSEDVVFTYQLLTNPNSGASHDLEDKFSSVEAVDKYTVLIRYYSVNQGKALYEKWQSDVLALPAKSAEMPDWISNLPQTTKNFTEPVTDPLYFTGLFNSAIHSKAALSALVDNDPANSPRVAELPQTAYGKAPVSFGSYVITDWTPGVSITARARADYFRGQPKIGTIVFKFIPSTDTLIASLQAGDVGMVTQDALDVNYASVLDKLDGITPYYIPGTSWEHIDFNLRKDPTDMQNLDPARGDKAVRQAVAYCINRQDLVDKIFFGKSSIANSVITPASFGYNGQYDAYAFNPEKGNLMLEAAGYKLGSDGVRT